MNRQRLFQIARWEYLQRVRSKAFVISLIVIPVMMVGMSLLPSLLLSRTPSEAKLLGLIDRTGAIADGIERRLAAGELLENGEPIWQLRRHEPTDEGLAAAEAEALAEETEGFLEVDGTADSPRFIWRSPNLADIQTGQAVRGAVQEVMTEMRVARAGIDSAIASSLTAPVPIEERKMTAEGESEADSKTEFMTTFFVAIVGVLLFMILILTTGQSLVRGLVEEKSNRIMEILVGAVTPTELMWGKLLGLGVLGLTQAFSWVLLAVVVALPLTGAGMIPEGMIVQMLEPLPLVALYLTLGYFFFAALYIGMGSLVTTEQEAQLVTQYLTIPFVAPIALFTVMLQDPNAAWVEAVSYIPILTPSIMMMRVVGTPPPAGTIVGTTLLLIVSTIAVTWGAAKIFRTAILLYGKRPTVREVVRLLRG